MSPDGLAVNIRVHPVSSLHFCSRRPLSQALLPTLSYVSTFPLNVYSSSGRSQGNECHLYLWMSAPGLGRSQARQEGPASAGWRGLLTLLSGPCCLPGGVCTHATVTSAQPLTCGRRSLGFSIGTLQSPNSWLLPASPLIPRLLASPAGSSSGGFALNFIPSEPHMWGQGRGLGRRGTGLPP